MAYGDTMIARGLKVYVGIDANTEMVPALLAGTVTASDILRLVHHDFGNAGVWWGIMGTFGDIVDFEDYAYSDDLLAQQYEDLEGGDVSIVLVGKRPTRDGSPWDPEHHNEPEAGGLMGNSYLQSGEQVELVEIRYNAGNGWRSLPAAGLRATASSGIPGMTIEEEWDLPSMGPGERAVTARIDGRLVGGLLWQVSDGIINYVQVDPEHRRRGIASALLEAARRLDPNVRHDVEENRSETGKEWVRAVGSKTATVGPVQHQMGVPFSNYRFSGQAHRFYIEDPEAPDYGGGNFAGSTPKTVAFLDVFDAGDWVDIAFLTTRGKFEGAGDYQRQGLAGRLVEAAYDYFAPKKIYWGRIMHDGAEALKNRYRQSHPQRTGSRTAAKGYHYAPRSARDDIAQHGLDWRRSPAAQRPQDPRSKAPVAIYFGPSEEWIRDMGLGSDYDLYEVDLDGVSTAPDPYQPDEAFYTLDAIPPGKIRRMAGALGQSQRTAGANGTLPPLTFRYDDGGDGSGRIVPFDPANDDWHAKQFGVGMISWNTEGKITWVQSYEGYERRGLATRMLEEARKHRPDIHHSEELSQDAQAWIRATGGLGVDQWISVAERRLEETGKKGRMWHVPRMHVDDPGWKAAHDPVESFVREVLASEGVTGYSIRVYMTTYGMDGTIAQTDGMNYIQISKEDVSTLTLLHECAHIINRTQEGRGHDLRFIEVAARLYDRFISPGAGEWFKTMATPPTGVTAGLQTYYHVTNYAHWPDIRANGLQPGPDGKVWLWDSVGHALHFADAWSNPAVPPCILVVRTEATVEPTHWGDAWTLPGAIEVYDVIRPEDFGHYQRDLDQFRQGSRTASGGGTIYRGVRMPFSDEIIGCFKAYEEREEMPERRSYKAGPLILDALERYIGRHSTGVGIHWSTRPEMAGVAAETGGQFRDFPVIIEATYTDADVVPEGDPLYHESGVWVGNGIEAEVLIKPGARLNVTGVWIVRGPWNYQTPSVDKCPKMNVRGDEYVNVLASPQRRTARQYFPLPERADGPILRNWNGYSQESQQRILATYVDLVEGTARPEPKQREPLVGLWTVKINAADRIIVDDLPGGGWVLLGAVFDHNYGLAEQQIAGWLAWRQRTSSYAGGNLGQIHRTYAFDSNTPRPDDLGGAVELIRHGERSGIPGTGLGIHWTANPALSREYVTHTNPGEWYLHVTATGASIADLDHDNAEADWGYGNDYGFEQEITLTPTTPVNVVGAEIWSHEDQTWRSLPGSGGIRATASRRLGEVVEEFQRDYGQRLLDPAEAHDRCKDYSDEFASRCQEVGIAAEVVSGLKFGEIPEMPGQRLVLGGHFAVQVGTTVYDWTARQFDLSAPVPLVTTIDQWRDEWLRLGSSIAG